jgi:hypothetical protein
MLTLNLRARTVDETCTVGEVEPDLERSCRGDREEPVHVGVAVLVSNRSVSKSCVGVPGGTRVSVTAGAYVEELLPPVW